MNRPVNPIQRGFAIAPDRLPEDEFLSIGKIFLMAKRQMRWVALCAGVGLLLALLYLLMAPPVYQSSSQILVDQNIGAVVGDVSTLPLTIQTDAEILSNTEVLKSTRLALAVVVAQKLADNEEFLSAPPSISRRLLQPIRGTVRWFGAGLKAVFGSSSSEKSDRDSSEEDKRLVAAQKLRSDLQAERVGRSFVINVTYRSHDPELAYTLLNATVDAFLVDQQLANVAASQEATKWMRVRLDDLARQSREAGLAVERFRAENNLSEARGELMSEQRLAELNAQLVLALAQQAEAAARSQQMDAIVAGGVETATGNIVSAETTTPNAALDALRERFADISRREESVTATWGAEHAQAISLRRERNSVAAELFRELQRIAAQHRSEATVAENRVQSLRNQIDSQSGSNVSSNQLLVELSGLRQQAESLKSLYGSSLTRYEETLQRQSFPITNLRVISPASEPEGATEPSPVRTLAMFLALGAIAGCGVGAAREFGDRTFRIGGDISSLLGFKFLGYLPEVTAAPKLGTDVMMRVNSAHPDPTFSETLHAIQVSVDRQIAGPSRVIGVISVLPGEGKSVTAANLAGYLAATGKRALLIDGDFRRSIISKVFGPSTDEIAPASTDKQWRAAVRVDEASGMWVLPNLARSGNVPAAVRFGSDTMKAVLQEARDAFDYIIVDLPPLGPTADAAALQSVIDGFVLVVAWGSTPVELTKGVLAAEDDLARKIVGAVLNHTDLSVLKKYGARGSDAQAYDCYSAYHNGDIEQPIDSRFDKTVRVARGCSQI